MISTVCTIETYLRMCSLQDHMWQHRQEERDLKRAENDIRRNQRELKRSLKHYELGQLTVRHPHPSTTYVRTYVCNLLCFDLPFLCDSSLSCRAIPHSLAVRFLTPLPCDSSLPCCAIPHSLAVRFLTPLLCDSSLSCCSIPHSLAV